MVKIFYLRFQLQKHNKICLDFKKMCLEEDKKSAPDLRETCLLFVLEYDTEVNTHQGQTLSYAWL